MAPVVETQRLPKTKLLPPWRVILHNDNINLAGDVIRAILRFTPLGKEDAIQKTMEAHQNEISILLITHRELAELYCDQFAACHPPIRVTAEPVE